MGSHSDYGKAAGGELMNALDTPVHPLQPILVFDFETTGLDVRKDHAVALGWSIITREGPQLPLHLLPRLPR